MPIVRNVINTVLACLFFLSVASFAEDHTVFYAKQISAQRYTAVEGGGYFPVLTELDNKDLVAVVRGGDRHMGVKGRLDWVRSTDGGKTWTLKTLAEGPMDHRNPAMGQLKDGSVLVAYEIDRSYGPNGESLKDRLTDGIYTLRSNDHGNTWKGPFKSPLPMETCPSPFGKIVQLPDGTALMNVYSLKITPGASPVSITQVYRSKDGGSTWGDPSVIAENYNETDLLVLPDGRILAMLRSNVGQHLDVSFSADKGRTWSPPHQVTHNMEHPANVILLKDGRLLLCYGERNRPFGVRAMLSRDLGQTWGPDVIILAADAQRLDCGYPSSVEVAPGKIVTLYYGVDDLKDTIPVKPDLRGIYARAIVWTVPD
ncbi:MAG: sialidase family protein [Acidobacteriota bacterium]|nr:sialidase family protein [Acidobacteriota bacterium]